MTFDRCRRCARLSRAAASREDTDRLSEQLLCAWSGCEIGVMASDHAIDVLARQLAKTEE